MLSSESSSRIWIDTRCGLRLFPINHKSESITGGDAPPNLPLGFPVFRMLANSFGGSKARVG
jgi:hypothetical protein